MALEIRKGCMIWIITVGRAREVGEPERLLLVWALQTKDALLGAGAMKGRIPPAMAHQTLTDHSGPPLLLGGVVGGGEPLSCKMQDPTAVKESQTWRSADAAAPDEGFWREVERIAALQERRRLGMHAEKKEALKHGTGGGNCRRGEGMFHRA
jgi:hypothetical protein